jgi:dolichol-phosphate mannosyltransferase
MNLPEVFHVLIIDDGSPDGTANIVKGLQNEYPEKLFLLERKGKQGLGTAYIAGFKWSLAKGYEYIFEMDADFSHNPNDLIRLYENCKNGSSDLSIGSRYVTGGKVENWPLNRILISYGASVYVRLITWMPVKDCTAGFVCYTRKVLESINLDEIRFIGYAFQIEMKYRAWKKGFRLAEIPITFVDRKEGQSKMTKGIVKEAILGVWKMRLT